MSIASDVASTACAWLEQTGFDCQAKMVSLTAWHLLLVFAVFVVVSIIAKFIRDINRLDRMFQLDQVRSSGGSIHYDETLVINAHRMGKLLEENGLNELGLRATATMLNQKYGSKYFMVEFRESGSLLFRKELKLRAGWYNYPDNEIRTDAKTLERLKSESMSREDDDTDRSEGAIGKFDLFLRPVRPLDIRHWLYHPKREIRLAIWIAIFAAFLEYSADMVQLAKAFTATPTT